MWLAPPGRATLPLSLCLRLSRSVALPVNAAHPSACGRRHGLLSCMVLPPNHSPRRTTMPDDRKTILIVDDDRELSDGLRMVLEKQGFHVLQATDGHQGKQMIYNHRPGLVILDMMMPR